MRPKSILGTLLFAQFLFFSTKAQDTLVLQPDATSGKDAMIWRLSSTGTSHGDVNNANFGNIRDYQANEWTWSGVEGARKSLMDFDLSSFNAQTQIVSATLYLYGNPTSGDDGHSNLSGSNACLLQRITSPWNEQTVTWNTRPAVSTQNEVTIAATTSKYQDQVIDVTQLVQDMVNDPANSHGMMISLADTNHFRRVVYASSDHADPNRRPKLVIISSSNISLGETPVNVSYFPNPFKDHITISMGDGENHELRLLDMSGRAVREIHITSSDEVHINTSGLSPGTYILETYTPDKDINRFKVVKY